MKLTNRNTFSKEERICSKLEIDRLFNGGSSKSLTAFPLRAVYLKEERANEEQEPVSILVSVPKKRFKHAVKRNRVKRQVREAYRLNKHALREKIKENDRLMVAFIWMDSKLHPQETVVKKVVQILDRIGNNI